MKPVLRIPVYRRLLAAYALNELAFMVGAVTLTLLVYGRTGSALGATAFFLVSQFVPAMISPLTVARVDHLHPRTVLPALYGLEAALFAILAWVASAHLSVAIVLALALADGVAALTARAVARAATVSVTAGAGLLREGNAVANAAFSVCYMVAPGVGGAVVAAGGSSLALLLAGAIFAAMGATLATARGLPGPAPIRTRREARVRAALRYARERPPIRDLLVLQTIAVLFFTIAVPVEVVLAQHTLHAGAAGYGAMLSAWGVGAVVGAAVYAKWRRLPSRDLISFGAGSLAIGFLLMAIAPSLAVAVAGAAFGGIGNGSESVSARTALQEETDEEWMAMMMSLNEAILQSIPGAGILIGGAIAALGSPRAALAVAGAGALAVAVVAWFVLAGLPTRRQPAGDLVGQAPGDPRRPAPRRDTAPTAVMRHQ